MTSFLSLPNELIQQVACYLSCSDVLTLLRVSRRLHEVCHDRLVYYHIAKNLIFNTSSLALRRAHLSHTQLEWPCAALMLDGVSLEQTIRVAFAVEQCIRISCTNADGWVLKEPGRIKIDDFGEWLPQLLAFQHPATLILEPEPFLWVQSELYEYTTDWYMHRRQTSEFININFVLTCITLSQFKANDRQVVIRKFADFFSPGCWEQSVAPPSHIGDVFRDTAEKLLTRIPEHSFGKYFHIISASAVLPFMLIKLAAQDPTAVQFQTLPVPSNMRFHTFMDIPEVFRAQSSTFTTCHLPNMITTSFISGKWHGCYTDQRRDFGRDQIDPPMREIRIVSRAPTAEEATRLKAKVMIDRASRGVDSHGEFLLQGRVCEDGTVNLLKQYLVVGWAWLWLGHVTPFGIVGAWGSPRQQMFGGYFWIWKEDWC